MPTIAVDSVNYLTTTGWTPIDFSTSDIEKTDPNVPVLSNHSCERIKTDGMPELEAFITAASVGYGISWKAARVLLQTAMTLLINRQDRDTQRSYAN